MERGGGRDGEIRATAVGAGYRHEVSVSVEPLMNGRMVKVTTSPDAREDA